MPRVKPSHIVSFSSEDPNNPASNLLVGDSFKRWKCKEPGEKDSFVVFKFPKAVQFTGFDICNDFTANIQILVARSGVDSPEFEVILSSSMLMGPIDSRNSTNQHKVRMFTTSDLCKPVSTQKWDLVKICCSQIFNTHVQFGLSFVTFNVVSEEDEDQSKKPKMIGGFSIKPGFDDDDDDYDPRPMRIGAMFQKAQEKKLNSPASESPKGRVGQSLMTNNSAIQQATTSLALAATSSSEEQVKDLLRKRKLDSESNFPKSPSGNFTPLLKRNVMEDKDTQAKKQLATSSPSTPTMGNGRKQVSSPKPGPSNIPVVKKAPPKKKRKPFYRLFEGVTFAMSGFENPLRGQLRSKAAELGAVYKPDWNSSCSHLICAFVNTPKFRQVKSGGIGKIVRKEWIEASYDAKCRFPWRRYCLDRNDKGPESEDEIHVLDDRDGSPKDDDDARPHKRKKLRVLESDSEEESETLVSANPEPEPGTLASHSPEQPLQSALADEDSETDYEADTDVEESSVQIQNEEDGIPFFKDLVFHFYEDALTQKDKLTRVINKHKGRVEDELTDSVDFVITTKTEWQEDFSEALSENMNLTFVKVNWITQCQKEERLLPADDFTILPN